MKALVELYYKKKILCYFLLPLALIYSSCVKLRRFLFQKNIFKTHKMPVPVIVIGNITLGGTGKTPLVIAMVELLKAQGFKPGVISRGYGSHTNVFPHKVTLNSSPYEVGDEPFLIHLRTKVPVVIDPNRPRAASYLLKESECNVLVSDDGLQHYALQRDIEIAVIDGQRKFGNGFIFPAGPLREPIKRLTEVDFIIVNTKNYISNLVVNDKPEQKNKMHAMCLIPNKIYNLKTKKSLDELHFFKNTQLVAVAGIGYPENFFQTLENLGLSFKKQPMPDHYSYSVNDFQHNAQSYYLMTEKDAVKCSAFATENMFYLSVNAKISLEFEDALLAKLKILFKSFPTI